MKKATTDARRAFAENIAGSIRGLARAATIENPLRQMDSDPLLAQRADEYALALRRSKAELRALLAEHPDLRRVWLADIPEVCRPDALRAVLAGDADWFLMTTSNEYGLNLVVKNYEVLKERGIYEEALLHAFKMTRTNWAHWSINDLRLFFGAADIDRLRALGDPLPARRHLTLYRGVAGKGAKRKEAGLSWTRSKHVAAWFACRFGLPDPAVLVTKAAPGAVFLHLGEKAGRSEDEFVLIAEKWERLDPMPKPKAPRKT